MKYLYRKFPIFYFQNFTSKIKLSVHPPANTYGLTNILRIIYEHLYFIGVGIKFLEDLCETASEMREKKERIAIKLRNVISCRSITTFHV